MAKARAPDLTEAAIALDALRRRVDFIEQSFIKAEDDVDRRDVRAVAIEKTIKVQTEDLQNAIKSMRDDFARIDDLFTRLSLGLKQAVKKDELERASMRVDRLRMEQLLSKRGLARDLEEWQTDQQASAGSDAQTGRDEIP